MRQSVREAVERPHFTTPTEFFRSTDDFEQASDSVVIDAISRGSVHAFTTLFDRTSGGVRTELATHFRGTVRGRELLAASYLEVWWLAGCRTESGPDVTDWVLNIVRRRIAAAQHGTGRHDVGGAIPERVGRPRPSHAERELATLLRRPVDHLTRY